MSKSTITQQDAKRHALEMAGMILTSHQGEIGEHPKFKPPRVVLGAGLDDIFFETEKRKFAGEKTNDKQNHS